MKEEKPWKPSSASVTASYTNQGLAYIFLFEWSVKNNTFYTGPKLMAKHEYNPMKGVYGWDWGYSRYFKKGEGKAVRFFLNLDFQTRLCRAYCSNSINYRTDLMRNIQFNYVAEAFISNGIIFTLFRNLSLGNISGVGASMESSYNSYIKVRRTFTKGDFVSRVFLRYKF